MLRFAGGCDEGLLMNRRNFILHAGAGLTLGLAGSAHAQVPAQSRLAIEQIAFSFLAANGVRGLSVAIGRQGRIEYARGFGLANLAGDAVTTRTRFRIASLSKPITAAAIMMLRDGGSLSLDDAVLGPGSILGERYGPTSGAVRAIRVHHLLSHTCGGWTNDGLDPTMRNPGLSQSEMIATTLANHPLQFMPGERQLYSNFGYCLLGRVIEATTGEPYAAWVRREVLGACGIDAMRVGDDFSGAEEADYFASTGIPSALNLPRLDANGGWIASPTDLVRFLMHVDAFGYTDNIISFNSARIMAAAPFPGAIYGHGWQINNLDNWWHTGILPGTAAFMCRTYSGFHFAALANGGGPETNLTLQLDQMMWRMAETVPGWDLY
jgi:CubicO group peptidase (beta-lactamase class C family)